MSVTTRRKTAADPAAAARARLHRDAELVRLARALSVDERELAFLDGADEHSLRELRLSVTDHLFERASAGLAGAAKLAGMLPGPVVSKLAEHALGPVLSARTVPLLDPDGVAAIGGRLPASFLAETAVHLDLRRAAPLIGALPEEKLRAAGAELADREEYVVLAAFVAYMEVSVLRGLLEVFDAGTLLRAAFLIEEPSRIDALVENLPDDRLDELHVAAREHDLWEESLAILAGLGDAQQKRFAASLARLGPAHHEALSCALRSDRTLLAIAGPLLEKLDAETRFAVTG
jgi:hypothetical protein